MSRPNNAELARTAVASARIATLTTYPYHDPPATTAVSVRDDDGALVLNLLAHRAAARQLLLRPLATVRVAPPGCRSVTLQGTARRLSGPRHRLVCFRLEAGAVRLGNQTVTVEEYRSAQPDPLREDAGRILGHLRAGHGLALAACLRAHGHHGARWAEPTAVDRYGLELAVLHDEGVATARLTFPRPVRSITDLPPGLSVILRAPGNTGHDHAD